MKLEQLLKIVSDSEKLEGINDALSYRIRRTRQSCESIGREALSDEALSRVAGGTDLSPACADSREFPQ